MTDQQGREIRENPRPFARRQGGAAVSHRSSSNEPLQTAVKTIPHVVYRWATTVDRGTGAGSQNVLPSFTDSITSTKNGSEGFRERRALNGCRGEEDTQGELEKSRERLEKEDLCR